MKARHRILSFNFFGLGRTGLGIFTRIWSQVVWFGVFIFAGRYFSIDEFGQFALATSIVVLMTSLLYTGIYQYIITSDDNDKIINTAFIVNISISLALFCFVVFFSVPISNVLQAPLLPSILWILSPAIIMSAAGAWIESLIIRHDRLRLFFYASIIVDTAGACLAITLIVLDVGPQSFAYSRVFMAIITLLLYYYFMPIYPRLQFDRSITSDILKFSAGLYGSTITFYMYRYGGDYLLSYYVTPLATGFYRLANRATEAVGQITEAPLSKISLSRLGEAQRLKGEVRKEWLEILLASIVVSWTAMAIIGISAPHLLGALLGQKWVAAAPIIAVLSLGKSVAQFGSLVNLALTIKGFTKTVFLTSLADTAVTLGALFVMSRFGAFEAAVGQAIASCFMLAIYIWYSQRLLHFTWQALAKIMLQGLAAVAFVALPTMFASWLAHAGGLSPLLALVLVGLTGASLWGILCVFVFRHTIRRAFG
jgi:O-antigen/teichoic acid export membrane protein